MIYDTTLTLIYTLAIISNMSTLYFDTETTGIDENSQICQLSYIIEDGEILSCKNFFFEVDSMNEISLSIHKLSLEMLKLLSKGKRFGDCAEEIYNDFDNADLLVAHNIGFDIKMLKMEFARLNIDINFTNLFCSMKSMITYCKLPKRIGQGYKQPKLIELVDKYVQDKSQIENLAKKLFNINANYHDARYDVCAMYSALFNVRKIRLEIEEKLCL